MPAKPAFAKPSFENDSWISGVDFSQRVLDIREQLEKNSDRLVQSNLQLAVPGELPLFQGMGRWQAWSIAAARKPELESLNAVLQTYDLWTDEWHGPITAPLSPDADPSKAACKTLGLLKMLDSYLGQGLVGKEVDRFFANYRGEKVDFREFYQGLASQASPSRPLPSWNEFKGWFEQPGHPILNAQLGPDNQLTIEQEGFMLYPSDGPGDKQAKFTLPLVIKFKDDKGVHTQRAILGSSKQSLELKSHGKVQWAYPNGGGNGWFRTRLSDQQLEAINQDAPQSLSTSEQLAYSCNQWRLVRHGSEPVGKFYDTLERVMASDAGHVGKLDFLFVELGAQHRYCLPQDRPAFERFQAQLIQPLALQLGLELKSNVDTPDQSMQKTLAIQTLARGGDPSALAIVKDLADRWKLGEKVPTFALALSKDPEVFDSLWTKARREISSGEYPASLATLTDWSEADGAAKVVNFILDPKTEIPQETRRRLIRGIYDGPAMDALWEAFQQNPQSLPEPADVAQSFLGTGHRKQLEELAKSHDCPLEVKERLHQISKKGAFETLALLPDQIHGFLAARSAASQAASGPKMGVPEYYFASGR